MTATGTSTGTLCIFCVLHLRICASSSQISRICVPHLGIPIVLLHLRMYSEVYRMCSVWLCHRYDDATAAEFLEHTQRYLVVLRALHHHYKHVENRELFHVTPKAHMVWHIAEASKRMSPSMSWCYMGEDHMRHCRQVCSRLIAGTAAWQVGRKFLSRWAKGFTWRFLARTNWLG